MNSMEGSHKIPTYVEYKNTLVYGSRHSVRTYLKYEPNFVFCPSELDLTVKLLTLSIYTRQTQQSAQSFRPCVSGDFDIWHPWSETWASLSTWAIFTVDWVSSLKFLSSNLCYQRYISPTIAKYCELLLRDVSNTLLKRSVGSRWWSVRPHGPIITVWTTECMRENGGRWAHAGLD